MMDQHKYPLTFSIMRTPLEVANVNLCPEDQYEMNMVLKGYSPTLYEILYHLFNSRCDHRTYTIYNPSNGVVHGAFGFIIEDSGNPNVTWVRPWLLSDGALKKHPFLTHRYAKKILKNIREYISPLSNPNSSLLLNNVAWKDHSSYEWLKLLGFKDMGTSELDDRLYIFAQLIKHNPNC